VYPFAAELGEGLAYCPIKGGNDGRSSWCTIPMEANDELVAEGTEVLASSEAILARGQVTLQSAQAHGVDIGPRTSKRLHQRLGAT